LDILPRLRTVKKSDGNVKVRNRRGYFASLPEDDAGRELRTTWSADVVETSVVKEDASEENAEEIGAESSEYPDYFAVMSSKTDFGVQCADKSRQGNDSVQHAVCNFTVYERPLFLRRVQQECLKQIKGINERRCHAWGSK
jgi:alkyl sulfatase BDS1-like metallo-beta-lactamase superfamily hydrolase